MDLNDPCRVAVFLIELHRYAAKSYTIQRALDMRAAGDYRGEQAWMNVFDALLALEATQAADRAPRLQA